MEYTLEIHKLSGQHAFLHHRQTFQFDDEYQAAMVLVATREGLPTGFGASMTYQKPGTGTHTNVRIREANPDFIETARNEIKRRGISGSLSAADVRALRRHQKDGKTAVEAGASRAMEIICRS